MLFNEMIAVYDESNSNPINTHYEQNRALLNVKAGVCIYRV
jgi:hypothetical protein